MAKKQKSERTKLVKEILKKKEITRSEANYLIKTGLGISIVAFSELSQIQYRYLIDCLVGLRPFSTNLQTKILCFCNENFKAS